MTHRLVFAGDSITDAGRDRADDESLGDGYVSLVADELRRRDEGAVVLNRGIAGNRAVDLERRWADEVLAEGPDVLTVYVGVNDTWRRFDSDDPTSVEDFEATCRRMLDTVPAATTVLLVEPYLVIARPEQRDWLTDLDPKRAAVARLAEERGARFVPLHEAMTAAAASRGAAAVAPDGVHPTPAGSRLIADAWLTAFDAALGRARA
ncbi:lipase [Cnuibacter physcomitrellae]|uniref:Uncharacterized protein n=1 Tax=Cnuibacter physcomitrellae TaxID=1619308 RepID=A0A1X9LH73_9MICO|nr:SGNH/GDSL hydrolase family protein [Cnuibacter physcomitrellae]ARJ04555.1 hypothetical protein B5808_04430 [Cnuibacter physcomitrellae]GGI41322.1 lipase [Cnuibacter physcomitrellae]